MLTDPIFYACAIPAVLLGGLAKGGFSGIGMLGLPILALGIPPLQAAAILLPTLIAQDVVSVWSFRKSWDGPTLGVMLPGAVVGVGLGYAYAAAVPTKALLFALGLISVIFALRQLWSERDNKVPAPSRSPLWVGSIFGGVSGFTSQIAHAGAPPFQMWVMPRGLPRDMFVGTSAIFFTVVNWMKTPAYLALGQFTRENLTAAAVLLPLAVASTFAGVWLVRKVDAQRFGTIIYVLLLATGAKLLWDGLA